MPIQWRPQMSVGNQAIDNDHRHLIDLINDYEQAIAKRDPDILAHAFNGLLDYARVHFAREEKLLAAASYPALSYHREVHQTLLIQVTAFHQDIVDGKRINLKEASQFLHDWLMGHVLTKDLKSGIEIRLGQGDCRLFSIERR